MGCINKEFCSALFLKYVLDWQISDPKGQSIEQVREIHDQIKTNAFSLIKSLEENNL